MSFNESMIERSPSHPIGESVGSYAELTRAIQVRYYRTVCPAEIGRTIDPPDLVRNLLTYSHICKKNKWPVIILRPELKRATWGITIMLPSRAFLDIAVNPSKLVDKLYCEARAAHKELLNECRVVSVMSHSYHMYQGLTLPAGETLAWCMAEALGQHTGAMSNA
jgi:hypothetical protein